MSNGFHDRLKRAAARTSALSYCLAVYWLAIAGLLTLASSCQL